MQRCHRPYLNYNPSSNFIEEGQGDGLTLGRSYRDAPEIDGMVILQGEVPLGEFVPVKIDGAMTYDLTGQVELKQGQVITLSA